MSDRKVPIDNSFDPEGPVFYSVVHVVCHYSSGTRKKKHITSILIFVFQFRFNTVLLLLYLLPKDFAGRYLYL